MGNNGQDNGNYYSRFGSILRKADVRGAFGHITKGLLLRVYCVCGVNVVKVWV